MSKKVVYTEPASYFTPSMKKVAREWDKQNGVKPAKAESTKKGKK